MKKPKPCTLSIAALLSVALAGPTANAADNVATKSSLEEIIVTAQKRSQTLIEVPQSVTVVSGETLEEQQ